MPSLKMAHRRKMEAAHTREMQRAQEKLQSLGLPECYAKEMANEMANPSRSDHENEDSCAEVDDLPSSVWQWLRDKCEEGLPQDCLHDFNLKVRFQGYASSGPPEHLTCILHVLCEKGCGESDFLQPDIQPVAVAACVGPWLEKFSPILEAIYDKIDHPRIAADAVVQGVLKGVAAAEAPSTEVAECAAAGCFVAIRKADLIEDEFLLVGCRRIKAQTAVMQKFIRFLEEVCASDEDDDEGSGED